MIIEPGFSEREARLYHMVVQLIKEIKDYRIKHKAYERSSWWHKFSNAPPEPPLPLNIRELMWEQIEEMFPDKPACGCARCAKPSSDMSQSPQT